VRLYRVGTETFHHCGATDVVRQVRRPSPPQASIQLPRRWLGHWSVLHWTMASCAVSMRPWLSCFPPIPGRDRQTTVRGAQRRRTRWTGRRTLV